MPANYQCYTMKNSLFSLSVLSPTFENAEQQQNTPHAKKKIHGCARIVLELEYNEVVKNSEANTLLSMNRKIC